MKPIEKITFKGQEYEVRVWSPSDEFMPCEYCSFSDGQCIGNTDIDCSPDGRNVYFVKVEKQ